LKYSERNITNFEARHNLGRKTVLKVKKEGLRDKSDKRRRQRGGSVARQALSVSTWPAQMCNEVCNARA
jgi:hypothetical protein